MADALVSGISDRKVMQVQVLFSAPEEKILRTYTAEGLFLMQFAAKDLNLFELLFSAPEEKILRTYTAEGLFLMQFAAKICYTD